MNPFRIFLKTLFSKETFDPSNVTSLYDVKINSLQGEPIQLSDYKNHYILFVNVASKCGFTPQYKQLQELSDKYKEKLKVIGVPCNQFGKQEPGTAENIASFCEVNYGVTFLITEKINVKGSNIHPLYKWLTQKNKNGIEDSRVKWNFQKYLINKEGRLLESFSSRISPASSKITNHIK